MWFEIGSQSTSQQSINDDTNWNTNIEKGRNDYLDDLT